jgi:hypothetical protein
MWSRKFIHKFFVTFFKSCANLWTFCIFPVDLFNVASNQFLSFPSTRSPTGFSTKIPCAFLASSTRATRPAHRGLLDLIFLTIFGDLYKTLSSPCNTINCSRSPTSSFVGLNAFPSTLFSNICSARVNKQRARSTKSWIWKKKA